MIGRQNRPGRNRETPNPLQNLAYSASANNDIAGYSLKSTAPRVSPEISPKSRTADAGYTIIS